MGDLAELRGVELIREPTMDAASPFKEERAPVIGIAHLDANACIRTGDPTYPVVYTDRDGKKHKMAWYNVIPFSDFPSSIQTMNGVGRSESIVRFTVPPEYVVGGDSYLDLSFNHSGLLDFNRSGLTVFMNGNLLGSVLLSEQTAATTTQRIKIPISALSTNTNELKFQVDLAPLSQCSFLDTSNLWFSVLPESVLNLPLAPATADTAAPRDLGSYPYLASLKRRLSRSEHASHAMLIAGMVLAVILAADVALSLFDQPPVLAPALRVLMLTALALLTAYTAIFEVYMAEKADRTLVRQYQHMESLFALAARELRGTRRDVDRLGILRTLGHACLAEHTQWILLHRDKRIDGLRW